MVKKHIRSSSDELAHVKRKIEKYTRRYDRLIAEEKTAVVMSERSSWSRQNKMKRLRDALNNFNITETECERITSVFRSALDVPALMSRQSRSIIGASIQIALPSASKYEIMRKCNITAPTLNAVYKVLLMSMYFDPPCSLLSVVPRVSPLGTRCYWMGKSQPNDTYSLS